MDTEVLKQIGTLGVGGAIAALMFFFYRKDVQSYTEVWRLTAEHLVGVVKENTASNVKLIALIESQERNQLRKNDILSIIDERINAKK